MEHFDSLYLRVTASLGATSETSDQAVEIGGQKTLGPSPSGSGAEFSARIAAVGRAGSGSGSAAGADFAFEVLETIDA